VVQWAKPKCQVSLADPQLEGKEEEEALLMVCSKGLPELITNMAIRTQTTAKSLLTIILYGYLILQEYLIS